MSTKHTSGPWHQVPFRLFIEDSRGRQLARVQIGGAETVQEDSANVAFIVRACNAHDELLAALEGFCAWAEANRDGQNAPMRSHAYRVARAAIAKAVQS